MRRMLCTLCLGAVVLMRVWRAAACDAPADGMSALERGYRQMYNLQFDVAHTTFRTWQQGHPDDPMGAVSHAAAYLFAELDRLHLLEAELFVDDARFVARTRPGAAPGITRALEGALALAQTD